MPINVKDYGATGNGSTNDAPAIQNAVNAAKALTVAPGVGYRATVYFPAGYYLINTPINLTNTNGIYLTGDGGSYLNSIIIGNTSGVMFDFTGSTLSGCRDLMFQSSTGYGATRSTIGVLFALSSTFQGLNCGIRNCYFEMNDYPTANGGFGTIAVLNVRSEEFFVHECLIRANAPMVFSYTNNLSETGTNFTVTSPFQTLASGTGSMGVTSILATSIQAIQRRQPALVLVGAEERAILCVRYTTNMRVRATIESFSQVLRVLIGGFDGNEINAVVANSITPTATLVDVSNANVRGLKLKVMIPNAGERNRTLLYNAPFNNGYGQIPNTLTNSEITCFDIADNRQIITPNLLRRSENVMFNTDQPFEKRGGRVRQLFNNQQTLGTVGSPQATAILRFNEVTPLPINNTNGGYYQIWIEGIIRIGTYGSGVSSSLTFQAQILIDQVFNGTYSDPSISAIILDKAGFTPTLVDVVSLSLALTFSGGIGTVTLTPRVSGSITTEPIFYEGRAELKSDYLANEATLFR
jgi:hypothetical protein